MQLCIELDDKSGILTEKFERGINIKGKRLTNKESIDMYENEIIQTEEMVSKLIEALRKDLIQATLCIGATSVDTSILFIMAW